MNALKQEVEANVVLHEQLALKRLRRRAPSVAPPERKRARWRSWWRSLLALARPVELVREVSPHHAPLARDQWDGANHLRPRIR